MNQVDSENSTKKILSEPDDERFPFKPFMTDFTPATEIYASINSHSLIEYKVRFFFTVFKIFFFFLFNKISQ